MFRIFNIKLPLPDLRALVVTGIFALASAVLYMLYTKPQLSANQGFMLLANVIFATCLVSVVNFLFGSSKTAETPKPDPTKEEKQ